MSRKKGTECKIRVKCRVCANEKGGFCLIKKCTIKLNKSRICDAFKNDFSKVKIKEKVQTVMRPDWYWHAKEARRAYRELLKKQEAEKQFEGESQAVGSFGDGSAAPDCLAGFRSTAGEIEVVNAPDVGSNNEQ